MREFAIRSYTVTENFSVVLHVFCTGVHDIEVRMVTRKGRVDDMRRVAVDVEENKTPIVGVEAIYGQRMSTLLSPRAVSKTIEITVEETSAYEV